MSTQAKARCPLCGKPAQASNMPFCSAGCRDRDLLNWLGDGYRLPVKASDQEADEAGLDSERPAAL